MSSEDFITKVITMKLSLESRIVVVHLKFHEQQNVVIGLFVESLREILPALIVSVSDMINDLNAIWKEHN